MKKNNSKKNFSRIRLLTLIQLILMINLTISAQTTNFKIGIFNGSTLNLPDVYPTGVPTDLTYLGNNTSQLNVLSEDGFNVFTKYQPSNFTSIASIKNLLILTQKHGMQLMTNTKDWYKANPSSTGTITNIYTNDDGEEITTSYEYSKLPGTYHFNSNLGDHPNFDDYFDNLYGDSLYKDIIWGHQICEESSLFNLHNSTSSSPSGSWPYTNYLETEIPLSYVLTAYDHFSEKLSENEITNHKLVVMEANHHDAITSNLIYDYENMYASAHYTPKHLIDAISSDAVFFEGSYTHFPSNWYDQKYEDIFGEGPKTRHYLGALKSIDFAKSKLSSVHDVIDIAHKSQVYNSSEIPNANWLWFQAYTSIIHGVDGIWFWGLEESWKDTEKPEDWDTNPARFNRENFSELYKTKIANLAKELRYLTNLGLLEKKSVYETKTDNILSCIVPYRSKYIPEYKNLPESLKNKIKKKVWNKEFRDKDNKGHEDNYGLRYTIRANENDVVMIISNPLPIEINVDLNFNSVRVPYIRNSHGVDLLFTDGISASSSSYKVNRDSEINLETNSVANKQYLPFSTDRKLNLTFGPMDVHILKFRAEEIALDMVVPEIDSSVKDWEDRYIYSNEGDGSAVHAYSPLIADVNNDGLDDIIFIFPASDGSGLVIRTKLSNGDGTWANVSSAQGDGSAVFSNPPLVADVNGDGNDDIVFIFPHWDGSSGLVMRTKLSNGNGTWTNISSTQGDGSAVFSNPPLIGDVNGDNYDDITFIFPHWDRTSGLVIRTKLSNGNGTWTNNTSVQGDGSAVFLNPALMGDVNGDDKDDIVFFFQHPDETSGLVMRTKTFDADGSWSNSDSLQGDGTAVHTYKPFIGDVNGDGFEDVVFSFPHWDGSGLAIRTKFSNGTGGWSTITDIHKNDTSIPALQGDFNGDCKMDLIFTIEKQNLYCISGQSMDVRTKLSKGNGKWLSDSRILQDIYPLAGNFYENQKDDLVVLRSFESPTGLSIYTYPSPYSKQECNDCSNGAAANLNLVSPNETISYSSLYGSQNVNEYCLEVENIIADGSSSYCEENYFLEIVEFDLTSWSNVGTPLYSNWVCEDGCIAPDNIHLFDFVPKSEITPNKIYKVKLAVGTPWNETYKFFSLVDCPGFGFESNKDDKNESLKTTFTSNFIISPNPTDDIIKVKLSNIDNSVTLKIHNLNRSELFSKKFNSKNIIELDLSKFKAGLYLITLLDDEGYTIGTKKFIKNQ